MPAPAAPVLRAVTVIALVVALGAVTLANLDTGDGRDLVIAGSAPAPTTTTTAWAPTTSVQMSASLQAALNALSAQYPDWLSFASQAQVVDGMASACQTFADANGNWAAASESIINGIQQRQADLVFGAHVAGYAARYYCPEFADVIDTLRSATEIEAARRG